MDHKICSNNTNIININFEWLFFSGQLIWTTWIMFYFSFSSLLCSNFKKYFKEEEKDVYHLRCYQLYRFEKYKTFLNTSSFTKSLMSRGWWSVMHLSPQKKISLKYFHLEMFWTQAGNVEKLKKIESVSFSPAMTEPKLKYVMSVK